jgi:hypothetical protein
MRRIIGADRFTRPLEVIGLVGCGVRPAKFPTPPSE